MAEIDLFEYIEEAIKIKEAEWVTKIVILASKPVGFQNMWISAKSNQQVKENCEHFSVIKQNKNTKDNLSLNCKNKRTYFKHQNTQR